MTVRWRLEDDEESYSFHVNPKEMGSPFSDVPVQAEASTSNVVMLTQGPYVAATLTFSGVILSQAHYEAFAYWTAKRAQIRLYDHYERLMSVVITEFNPTPVRSHNPWKHTYSMSAVILREP